MYFYQVSAFKCYFIHIYQGFTLRLFRRTPNKNFKNEALCLENGLRRPRQTTAILEQ